MGYDSYPMTPPPCVHKTFTLTNTLTPVNEFGVRGSSHISETVMKLAPYRGAHLTGGGGGLATDFGWND